MTAQEYKALRYSLKCGARRAAKRENLRDGMFTAGVLLLAFTADAWAELILGLLGVAV